jgi:hypothetical protein
MSYDLYFRSRLPGRSISATEFAGYFRGRRMYEVRESQAWYSNEDSGVYFCFEYLRRGADSDPEKGAEPSLIPVLFNLNFMRPSPFALEAELSAFVKTFDLIVSDPQDSGMGDGSYSSDGFLRGWNAGNEFACRAITAQDPAHKVLTLPSAQLAFCWKWNYRREARQKQIGDAAFIPKIFFFEADGRAVTGVVWGDGVPIIIPVVDFVIVPRERLAPRGWFRSKDDIVEFTWTELEPIIRPFRRGRGEQMVYELSYEATPPEIEQAIRAKRPPKKTLMGVGFDQILDQEIQARIRA